MTSTNWYKTFFKGITTEFWQKAVPAVYTANEIDFILDILNLPAQSHLLDTPCGFGRHSLALARKGYQLTAIDISEEYIQQIADIKTTASLNIQEIQGDILSIELPKNSFDGALCLGNSFCYFPVEDMQLFIQKVSESLKSKAKWVINTGMLAESILPSLETNSWMQVDDIYFLTDRTYDVRRGCLDVKATFIRNGQTEVHHYLHWIYTLAEIERMLHKAGLMLSEVYSSTDRQKFGYKSPQAYLVVEKV